METELRFTVVEIHTSPWEAHISRALLASEGVPAMLASEHQVRINWAMSLAFGGVRLLVPAEYVASAREIFAARDRGDLEAAVVEQEGQSLEACAHCGSSDFTESKDWLAIFLALIFLFLCEASYPPAKRRTCSSCKKPFGGDY